MHIPTMVFRGHNGHVLSPGRQVLIAEDFVRGLSYREHLAFRAAFLDGDERKLLSVSTKNVPILERYAPGILYRSLTPTYDDLNITARLAMHCRHDATLSSIGLSMPRLTWVHTILGYMKDHNADPEKIQKLGWILSKGRPL